VSDAKLSYHFPSVDEAYLRRSWTPDDLLVGVRTGQIVVHAGGIPVLSELSLSDPPKDLHIQNVDDKGDTATIHSGNTANRMEITINRQAGTLRILKTVPGDWKWYSDAIPKRDGNTLSWGKHASLRVIRGEIVSVEPDGFAPLFATGFNKLKLNDPAPKKYALVTLKPTARHEIELEITR